MSATMGTARSGFLGRRSSIGCTVTAMSELPPLPPTPSLPSRFEVPAPSSYALPDGLTVTVVPVGGMAWTFPADLPVESEEA